MHNHDISGLNPKKRQKAHKMGLENVDLGSFKHVITSMESGFITEMSSGSTKRSLNTVTKEPYIPCKLTGEDLTKRVIPAAYYNAKIGKPIMFVGPSGTGKTAISECIIKNFYNGSVYNKDGTRKTDDQIKKMKRAPPRRIQNYANILPEAVVGEWNAWKLLRARADIDPDELWTPKYFKMGVLSQAVEEGRGILLDEITRAGEETQNVYLEPLREGKVTVEGNCFGNCESELEEKGIKSKPKTEGFQVFATANEGDIGTLDLSTALQTRLSRIPIGFMSQADELNLVLKQVFDVTKAQATADQRVIAEAASCLTDTFRTKKSMDVRPSIKDGTDLAKMLSQMQPIDPSTGKELPFETALKNKESVAMIAESVKAILGKNKKDALTVVDALNAGVCGISPAGLRKTDV